MDIQPNFRYIIWKILRTIWFDEIIGCFYPADKNKHSSSSLHIYASQFSMLYITSLSTSESSFCWKTHCSFIDLLMVKRCRRSSKLVFYYVFFTLVVTIVPPLLICASNREKSFARISISLIRPWPCIFRHYRIQHF